MFFGEGDYMKLIYFDESTASDYLKIIQNGKESKQTVEKKKNQNQTSLGGKFGIGPMFSKLFESLFCRGTYGRKFKSYFREIY